MEFTVTFLGTGVSTSIPCISCLLDRDCPACQYAAANPESKTARNNVSIAITYQSPVEEVPGQKEEAGVAASIQDSAASMTLAEKTPATRDRCILVDVGKTFRQAALKWLVPMKPSSIDAIFITHDHADAMFGLDDVRDLQRFQRCYEEDGKTLIGYRVKDPLVVYANAHTLATTAKVYPYLHRGKLTQEQRKAILMRRFAQIEWEEIPNRHEMEIYGMRVETFPVFHGGDYISLGFSFGSEEGR